GAGRRLRRQLPGGHDDRPAGLPRDRADHDLRAPADLGELRLPLTGADRGRPLVPAAARGLLPPPRDAHGEARAGGRAGALAPAPGRRAWPPARVRAAARPARAPPAP